MLSMLHPDVKRRVRPQHSGISRRSKTGPEEAQTMAAVTSRSRHVIKFTSTICVAFVALILANPAAAQQKTPPATDQAQSIKRIPLQRFDVPGTAYETVIGIAEIAPNVTIGRHTHPGPESGYLLEVSSC
jgi:hypothetical protein